ncbi:MAG: diaminobutyrate acetyltransferase [Gammaproteobacteria bacterium]|nr:diaminobutyrate acetyltransferase [Gammaproteobacteria bacterium]
MSFSQSQTMLRPPTPSDGASVFSLINRCPPLDSNSMYCNLLQCTHFANTSVAALQADNNNEEIVGFISAYLIPDRQDTLFIWQVAVDERARGIGLAGNMLKHILDRSECSQVTHLETTITESNKASWALFKSLATSLETGLKKSIMFDRDAHLAGEHDTEFLARIGPFKLSPT